MMKKILLLLVTGAVMFSFSKSLHAYFGGFEENAVTGPVVVELFTSQSCSSCPPADRFLAELAKHENVIPLGFHVTYWDHLHWKDTVSREFATMRQRAYSANYNQRRVYTPQMRVNGQAEFVGSNRGKFILAVKASDKIQVLDVNWDGDDEITVNLPAGQKGKYTLWLYGIGEDVDQSIASGENRGRRVNYVAPVLTQNNAGHWFGEQTTKVFARPSDRNATKYVVIAQEENGFGRIVAAGQSR